MVTVMGIHAAAVSLATPPPLTTLAAIASDSGLSDRLARMARSVVPEEAPPLDGIINAGVVPGLLATVLLAAYILIRSLARRAPTTTGPTGDPRPIALAGTVVMLATLPWVDMAVRGRGFLRDLVDSGPLSTTPAGLVRTGWNASPAEVIWPQGGTDRLLAVVAAVGGVWLVGRAVAGWWKPSAPWRAAFGVVWWAAVGAWVAWASLAPVINSGVPDAPQVAAIAAAVGLWGWAGSRLLDVVADRNPGALTPAMLKPMGVLGGLVLYHAGYAGSAQQVGWLAALMGSVILIGLLARGLSLRGLWALPAAAMAYLVLVTRYYGSGPIPDTGDWPSIVTQPNALAGLLLMLAPLASTVVLLPFVAARRWWWRLVIGGGSVAFLSLAALVAALWGVTA